MDSAVREIDWCLEPERGDHVRKVQLRTQVITDGTKKKQRVFEIGGSLLRGTEAPIWITSLEGFSACWEPATRTSRGYQV